MGRLDLPPTTSASQLISYTMCPRKFAFRYLEDVPPEFRSTALILGSAVHGGIGWFFEERLGGREPTIEAACTIAAADVAADVAPGGVRLGTSTAESLEDDARRLVKLYLESRSDMKVAAVERKLQLALADRETGEIFGRPLKGYLDLVLEDGTVVELKTASRRWSESDLARNLQLGAYSFALCEEDRTATKLAVHVLVKLKREPRLESFDVRFTRHELAWWQTAVRDIEAAIAAGHFPPTPSPLCHQCEYQRACSERRTSVAVRRPEAPSRPQLSVAFAM